MEQSIPDSCSNFGGATNTSNIQAGKGKTAIFRQ